jgi:hypothetical protein
MKIEHKTPSLEDRIGRQDTLNSQLADLICTLEAQVKELRKEYNSGRLALNELTLLKSLKDKKIALLNLETMQFIQPQFV